MSLELFSADNTLYGSRLGGNAGRARPIEEGERLLYSLAVGDVAHKPVLVCSGSASVQDAARQMSGADTSM